MPTDRPVPVPCYYRRELTGTEREARGLSHTKRWGLCLHPEKPLGTDVVCPCKGCKKGRCPGYTPDPPPLL